MRYDPDEDRRLTIRLDDDLRALLSAEARRQMRSLCSEIKFRLRQTAILFLGAAGSRGSVQQTISRFGSNPDASTT
jgi:hypothetical protein